MNKIIQLSLAIAVSVASFKAQALEIINNHADKVIQVTVSNYKKRLEPSKKITFDPPNYIWPVSVYVLMGVKPSGQMDECRFSQVGQFETLVIPDDCTKTPDFSAPYDN